jgi:hypothetical protein
MKSDVACGQRLISRYKFGIGTTPFEKQKNDRFRSVSLLAPHTKYHPHISSPFSLPNELGNYIFKQHPFCLFFRSTPERFEVSLIAQDRPVPLQERLHEQG